MYRFPDPLDEDALKTLVADPRYGDPLHPEYPHYRRFVDKAFSLVYPDPPRNGAGDFVIDPRDPPKPQVITGGAEFRPWEDEDGGGSVDYAAGGDSSWQALERSRSAPVMPLSAPHAQRSPGEEAELQRVRARLGETFAEPRDVRPSGTQADSQAYQDAWQRNWMLPRSPLDEALSVPSSMAGGFENAEAERRRALGSYLAQAADNASRSGAYARHREREASGLEDWEGSWDRPKHELFRLFTRPLPDGPKTPEGIHDSPERALSLGTLSKVMYNDEVQQKIDRLAQVTGFHPNRFVALPDGSIAWYNNDGALALIEPTLTHFDNFADRLYRNLPSIYRKHRSNEKPDTDSWEIDIDGGKGGGSRGGTSRSRAK